MVGCGMMKLMRDLSFWRMGGKQKTVIVVPVGRFIETVFDVSLFVL